MNTFFPRIAGLLAVLLLSGCGHVLYPLDYKTSQSYVPVTLGMDPVYTRSDQQQQRQTVEVLKNTGAFSLLDGGYSKNGYSLLISEPVVKGDNSLWPIVNIATLLTFPFPYHYKYRLRGTVLKDGELLKSYNYSREGWSVFTWYVPMPSLEAKRQMLDQLLVEMDKDKVIPYER